MKTNPKVFAKVKQINEKNEKNKAITSLKVTRLDSESKSKGSSSPTMKTLKSLKSSRKSVHFPIIKVDCCMPKRQPGWVRRKSTIKNVDRSELSETLFQQIERQGYAVMP